MSTAWNQHALFSATKPGELSSRWATPWYVFEHFNREFRFDLDAAAEAATAKVPHYLGPDHHCGEYRDTFSIRWSEAYSRSVSTVWLNPPYGLGVGRWLELARHEARCGLTVAVLILARTDTKWWHDIVMPDAAEVRLIRGRITFLHPETGEPAEHPCPAPSALVVFRPGPTFRPSERFSSVTIPKVAA